MNKFDEAETLFLTAWSLVKVAFGVHPKASEVVYNLHSMYKSCEKFFSAYRCLWMSIQIDSEHLGALHPEVIQSKKELAFFDKTFISFGLQNPLLIVTNPDQFQERDKNQTDKSGINSIEIDSKGGS